MKNTTKYYPEKTTQTGSTREKLKVLRSSEADDDEDVGEHNEVSGEG